MGVIVKKESSNEWEGGYCGRESRDLLTPKRAVSCFIEWKGEGGEGRIENRIHELYLTSFSYPAISPTPRMLIESSLASSAVRVSVGDPGYLPVANDQLAGSI